MERPRTIHQNTQLLIYLAAFLPARRAQAETHLTLEAHLDLVIARAETEEVAMVIVAVATASIMHGHISTCHGKGKVAAVAATQAAEAEAGATVIHQMMMIPSSRACENR